MSNTNNYHVKLGEMAKVKPGVFSTSVGIVYAGLLSDSIFSIAVTWSFGHNSMAYNLYLPRRQKNIIIPKGKIQVESLSADEFRFSFISD